MSKLCCTRVVILQVLAEVRLDRNVQACVNYLVYSFYFSSTIVLSYKGSLLDFVLEWAF
jgi:hypothetical protein